VCIAQEQTQMMVSDLDVGWDTILRYVPWPDEVPYSHSTDLVRTVGKWLVGGGGMVNIGKPGID
jgi:hypothetical protein